MADNEQAVEGSGALRQALYGVLLVNPCHILEGPVVPTTVTGLALLVVLLLPGLTFATVRDRKGSERRPSPFRETGAVVFCSVLTELAALAVFAMLRGLRPDLTPDIGRLVREGATYARVHYAELAWWAGGVLIFACVIAAIAASITGKRPHSSVMSAWWVMFEKWFPGENPIVGCTLEDGSYIEGQQASFNVSSDDSPDRDLVLVEPLKYRAPGATETHDVPWGAACVSARRIVTMFVSYPPGPAEQEGEAAAPASAPAA
ncbi:DUF6338 family protein [Streptomyces chartreusis]|uniref:DUF6338 family protein n=1 Tax=Streptomyces chartreusis TaxID=1969 RepID=UPI0033D18E9A